MKIDFQYATDFLGMNDPRLSHTCMHLLCTEGEGSFVFNAKCYQIEKNDLVVMPNPSRAKNLTAHPDLQVEWFAADNKFLEGLLPSNNYSVGNIEVGNTKIVADYISEIKGADQFEIVTHKYDGMAYMPLIELAKEEANKGELPPYEGTAPDLSQYDTVFIGGPVWWGTYPQVMFTLFKDINLDGKTVIPFTTHEGSGLASCASDVKKAFPKAKVTGEFSIYGHEVRTERAKVEKWLKGL